MSEKTSLNAIRLELTVSEVVDLQGLVGLSWSNVLKMPFLGIQHFYVMLKPSTGVMLSIELLCNHALE